MDKVRLSTKTWLYSGRPENEKQRPEIRKTCETVPV